MYRLLAFLFLLLLSCCLPSAASSPSLAADSTSSAGTASATATVYNVTDYGCLGDGNTDCVAPLHALLHAIDSSPPSEQSVTISFPPGTFFFNASAIDKYYISITPEEFPTLPGRRIGIVGAAKGGPNATVLAFNNVLSPTFIMVDMTTSGGGAFSVEQLAITRTVQALSGQGFALNLHGVADAYLGDLSVSSDNCLCLSNGSSHVLVQHCDFLGAVKVRNASDITFEKSRFFASLTSDSVLTLAGARDVRILHSNWTDKQREATAACITIEMQQEQEQDDDVKSTLLVSSSTFAGFGTGIQALAPSTLFLSDLVFNGQNSNGIGLLSNHEGASWYVTQAHFTGLHNGVILEAGQINMESCVFEEYDEVGFLVNMRDDDDDDSDAAALPAAAATLPVRSTFTLTDSSFSPAQSASGSSATDIYLKYNVKWAYITNNRCSGNGVVGMCARCVVRNNQCQGDPTATAHAPVLVPHSQRQSSLVHGASHHPSPASPSSVTVQLLPSLSDQITYYPEDYGCLDDGVTDCTAPLQNLLADMAKVGGGGLIQFGPGTFLFNDTSSTGLYYVKLDSEIFNFQPGENINITGSLSQEGTIETYIDLGSAWNGFLSVTGGFDLNASESRLPVSLSSLNIRSENTLVMTQPILYFSGAQRVDVYNIWVSAAASPVVLVEDSSFVSLQQCQLESPASRWGIQVLLRNNSDLWIDGLLSTFEFDEDKSDEEDASASSRSMQYYSKDQEEEEDDISPVALSSDLQQLENIRIIVPAIGLRFTNMQLSSASININILNNTGPIDMATKEEEEEENVISVSNSFLSNTTAANVQINTAAYLNVMFTSFSGPAPSSISSSVAAAPTLGVQVNHSDASVFLCQSSFDESLDVGVQLNQGQVVVDTCSFDVADAGVEYQVPASAAASTRYVSITNSVFNSANATGIVLNTEGQSLLVEDNVCEGSGAGAPFIEGQCGDDCVILRNRCDATEED